MISMLTAGVYTLVDGFFVGWGAGNDGLAAINVAFPLSLLIVACGEMIGTGGAINIALARGRGARRTADLFLGNSLALLVPAAVLLAGLIPFLNPILSAVGAAPALLPAAREYAVITLGGGIFMMAAVCLVAAMRNDGAPKPAWRSWWRGSRRISCSTGFSSWFFTAVWPVQPGQRFCRRRSASRWRPDTLRPDGRTSASAGAVSG